MQLHALALVHLAIALLLAPILLGLVNRTKAKFAGRRGQPVMQTWYDLAKLLHKDEVRSRTTTPVFGLGPVVGLAAAAIAAALVPMAGGPAIVAFPGDLVLVAYLFGLARFFTVGAALDTGSAFEGMGASREVLFSALAEPALFLGLAVVGRRTGSFSLTSMLGAVDTGLWTRAAPELALAAIALGIVLLAENARIPVDDPNTHLELTMIHEVMVLDHSGPSLAAIEYGSALKLWVLGSVLVGIAVPVRTGSPWVDGGAFLAGMAVLAIAIGIVESTMARLRLVRVPQLLVSAGGLAAIALVLTFR